MLVDDGTTTTTFALDGRRLGAGAAKPARIAADGEVSVATSSDGTVVARAWPHRVVVERAGAPAGEIEIPDAEVTALAVDGAAQTIAIGTSRGTIELWDERRRTLVARIPAHTQRTTWIGAGGDRLWSASSDGTLRSWPLAPATMEVTQLAREASSSWGSEDRAAQRADR